jgi:hypothetical protein
MSPEREPRTANREALVKAALKFLAANKIVAAELRQVVLVVETEDGARGRLTIDLDRLGEDLLTCEGRRAAASPADAPAATATRPARRNTSPGPRG